MNKIKQGTQLFTVPPSRRVLKTCIEINRDKLLDEAIFVAICGRNQIKQGSKITGVVRLKMAKYKLEEAIRRLEKRK